MTYWILRWLDHRWRRWNARGIRRHNWPDRRPRLWSFTLVPLSTWLRRPSAGWESYQAHIGPILFDRETRQLIETEREREG